jgi:uncharacterized protein (TIGR02391 family)
MNIDDRALKARAAIQRHLREIESIPTNAASDGNFVLARQRLSRWRDRVIGSLAQHVDSQESERFSKLRKGSYRPNEPLQNLVDEVQMYQGFLEALAEELERDPSQILGTDVAVPEPRARSPRIPQGFDQREADRFKKLHPTISRKCQALYESGEFAEAVEKSFKIVRDRLRNLTGYETGGDAFGKGRLHVKGAAARHVDGDFNTAVKFLTMAIDNFRNEKSHTSDARIDDPNRAYEYLTLSSLALNLLEDAEVIAAR